MVEIEHHPDQLALKARGVFDWPVREKEVSRFDWHYDAEESCYLPAGVVTVTPAGGAPVHIRAGDFVTFAAGLDCVRDITAPLRKHYAFNVLRKLS